MKRLVGGVLIASMVLMSFPLVPNAEDANQTPTLKAVTSGNHTKVEWAVEMLDEDVLYQTGFEENDELPNLYYNSTGDRRNGGQEFTTTDSFEGTRSLLVNDSYTYGNYKNTDLNGNITYNDWSASIFSDRKLLANGTDLSISFHAKSIGTGSIFFQGIGGRADFGQPLNITLLEDVNTGDTTAKVSNPQFFKNYVDKGTKYYLSSSKDAYDYFVHVTSVDLDTSTITVNRPFTGDFSKGDKLLKHNQRSPVNFPTRTVDHSDWRLYNVNTKVAEYEDYNTLKRGIELWIRTTTHDTVLIDDMKMGYATKAQLFRDGEKLYEGFLADFEDSDATDKESPTAVSDFKVSNKNGLSVVELKKPNDKGTDYSYQVKALAHNGMTYDSSIETVNVTSGVSGYSYIIDSSASTEPSNKINSTSDKIDIPYETSPNDYLHVRVIDGAGNASKTTHIPLKGIISSNFSLTVPEVIDLPSITIMEEPTEYSTSFNSSLSVTNLYPDNDEDWRLSVSATPLTLSDGSNYSLPAGSLTISPPTQVINPINNKSIDSLISIKGKTPIDGTSALVSSSSDKTRVGVFNYTFPKQSLNVLIDPTTTKPGNYSTTLTWELVKAP